MESGIVVLLLGSEDLGSLLGGLGNFSLLLLLGVPQLDLGLHPQVLFLREVA